MNKESQALMKSAGLASAISINYEQSQLSSIGIQGTGFGFDPSSSMRLFSVESGVKKQDIVIEEITVRENPKPLSRIQKAIIRPEHWLLIAPTVASIFNERLRNTHKKVGTWKKGKVALAESFGKELCVLAWALEEQRLDDANSVRKAITQWQSLSPEERWWLFLMANARYGSWPEGIGKGWRKAIGIALTDFGDESDSSSLVASRVSTDGTAVIEVSPTEIIQESKSVARSRDSSLKDDRQSAKRKTVSLVSFQKSPSNESPTSTQKQ